MHHYLRAIGFHELKTTKELDQVLDAIIENPNRIQTARDAKGNEIAEMTKEYGRGFGIRIIGQFVDEEEFEIDYYYPYFTGNSVWNSAPKRLRANNPPSLSCAHPAGSWQWPAESVSPRSSPWAAR